METSPDAIRTVVTVELIKHYRDNADFQRLIDDIQYSYKCCGITVNAYRDWNYNAYFNCSKNNPSPERCSVPPSCCRPKYERQDIDSILSDRFCGQNVLAISEQEAWQLVYTRSCVSAVILKVRSYALSITITCALAFFFLFVLRLMAIRVREEVISLTEFYEKYEDEIRRGERKTVAKERALHNVPKGCVVVSPKDRSLIEAPSSPPPKVGGPVLVSGAPTVTLPPPYTKGVSAGAVPEVARFKKEREFMVHSRR